MPRPNAPRSLFAEPHVAVRIATERESRGWSYDGLAKRLTGLGCAIQSSAIYKIEKAKPRRRITVDELIAFAQVFDLSVEEMLADPTQRRSAEAVRLLERWSLLHARYADNKREAFKLIKQLDEVMDRLGETVSGDQTATAALRAALPKWYPSEEEGPGGASWHDAFMQEVLTVKGDTA